MSMSTQGTTMAPKARNVSAMAGPVLAWLSVLLLVFLALTKLKAPAPAPATAPPNEFSAERGLIHIRAIAAGSHPIGSDANDAVRKYLLAQLSSLGLNPQIFDGTGVRRSGSAVIIARTHDILGRLPGVASSGAIMLMAHYDSVPLAPGAADDGAGVAAVLESLRALRAEPPLKNDLIVLFTDGEEAGLLGAEAFATGHPWIKDVSLIMNFEARGNRGPSMLFETSPGNSFLIEATAHFASHPIGSSLFYSLYKLLPNDTDFTIFRPFRIPGLNFAFGENLEAYHSGLDTAQNLSPASLQHQGSYSSELTRHFGQIDLSHLKESMHDDVFFNWVGSSMITYSESWVLPGELLVTLLLVSGIVLSIRRSQVRIGRTMLAFLSCIAILLVVPAVLAAVQWLLSWLLAGRIIFGDSLANSYLLAGLVLLGFCTAGALIVGFQKRLNLLELSLAGLIIVALLSWPLAFMLPAGSYVLFWPLLLMTLGQVAIAFTNRVSPCAQAVASIPGTAITILLFTPLIYVLYIFLTLQLITIVAIGFLLGLFFVIASPFLSIAIYHRRWYIAVLLLFVGACTSFGIAATLSHYSAQYPRRDTLLYSMNADNHTAVWISYDRSLDPWTAQFFPNGKPETRLMPEYLAGSDRPVLSAPASPLELDSPIAEIKTDEKERDIRKIRMNIRSQRNARVLRLTFLKDVEILSIKIGTREISVGHNAAPASITLLGMGDQGADLELAIRASDKISFWFTDQSSGFPAEIKPRPADIIAGAGSDSTLICRKYSW
jgi:hypothetical protein